MAATAITGAAGAYYVAGELSQRGWVASLTWGNAPRTDILAQRFAPPIVVAIQVKTRTSGEFALGKAAENPAPKQSNEWYILVALKGVGARPDHYIVPRNHVAAYVYVGFRAWLAGTPKPPHQRNPHNRRDISPSEFEGYREAWELLERPASRAPWRLKAWLWDEVDARGLPEGHPGLGRRPGT